MPDDPPGSGAAPVGSPGHGWRVLWRFGRPHTLYGTTLAVITLFVLAMVEAGAATAGESYAPPITLATAVSLAAAWLAALAANIAVVGLNQLTDVAIDRVNKPNLPLPAGHLQRHAARRIVGALAACALLLSAVLGPWMLGTVALSMAIGGAYSLPPLRLKRRAVTAALSIATVRGPLVNLGLYGHFRGLLGGPVGWPPSVLLLATFFFLFTLGIAVAKDIGDVRGDRRYRIATFAARRGERPAILLALLLLASPYLLVIAFYLRTLPDPASLAVATAHALLLALLLLRGAVVRREDPLSIARWYRSVWRFLYVEYALWLALLSWYGP